MKWKTAGGWSCRRAIIRCIRHFAYWLRCRKRNAPRLLDADKAKSRGCNRLALYFLTRSPLTDRLHTGFVRLSYRTMGRMVYMCMCLRSFNNTATLEFYCYYFVKRLTDKFIDLLKFICMFRKLDFLSGLIFYLSAGRCIRIEPLSRAWSKSDRFQRQSRFNAKFKGYWMHKKCSLDENKLQSVHCLDCW